VQDDTGERLGQQATHEIACRSKRFEIGADLNIVVRSAPRKERLRSGFRRLVDYPPGWVVMSI
jgi:hypothetical protein